MLIPYAFDPTKTIVVSIDVIEYADMLYRDKVANLPNFYMGRTLRGTPGFIKIVQELRSCGLDLFVVVSIMKYLENTIPLQPHTIGVSYAATEL